jgi:hypothetical protein
VDRSAVSRSSYWWIAIMMGAMASMACSGSPTGGPAVTEIKFDEPDASGSGADAAQADSADQDVVTLPAVELRVASYNASLYRDRAGGLIEDLGNRDHEQARAVAQIIQLNRPDVVLLNEFDYDAQGEAARLFRANFLEVGQGGQEPIVYPYVYVAASNTGIHSGVDLDNNGQAVSTPGSREYGNDAFGYGIFEGQYAFAVFSRYPLLTDQARTFQRFLWKDMPGNIMPPDWYSAEAVEVFRLSSKNHIDLPVLIDGHVLHVLASHPTPPAFDGAERRNVRRNNDEIRLWVDYLTPGAADYLVDDQGASGGLDPQAFFVVVGDLNSDPFDGGSRDAIKDLVGHARITDPLPASEGAVEKSARDGMVNRDHRGDPKYDTADFSDHSVGNLRVDYALPSSNTQVLGSGVFWPVQDDPHYALSTVSDHHLVWVDLRLRR